MAIIRREIVDLWGVVPQTKSRISHRLALICIFMYQFMIFMHFLNISALAGDRS